MNNISHNKKEMNPKKKAITIIISLVLIGFVAGLIVSIISNDIAIEKIESIDADAEIDIIAPTVGIISICIGASLLLGLIIVYVSVFRKTRSKFIFGLLLFLCPLFVKSLFAIGSLHAVTVISSIRHSAVMPTSIRETVGFSGVGFGIVLIIYSIFELTTMSVLLYLSME